MPQFADELPEAIRDAIKRHCGTLDTVQIALASDIGPDGNFGEQWLVVTDRDLLILDGDASFGAVTLHIPVTRITGAMTQTLVGVSILEVQVDGHTTEVLRFSNSLLGKFNRAAKQIEALTGKEVPLLGEVEQERKRCERCGRLLDTWSLVCPKCVDRRKILLRLLRYAMPYKWTVVMVSVLTLSATALDMVPPYFTKILIDHVLIPVGKSVEAKQKIALLTIMVAALIATRVVSSALSIYRGRMGAFLGSKITFDVRAHLYQALQRLSLSYYDKRQVGAVMTRVTQDTNHLAGFLVEGAQHYVVNILLIIGIAGVLVALNWRLGLLVLVPTPVVVLATTFVWRQLMRKLHHFWQTLSRLSATLNDTLSGIRVVKAFGQEDLEIGKFETRSAALYDASLRVEQTFATVFPTLGLIIAAGSILVWWFGGREVILGATSLGTLMAFFAYLGMFYGPLQILTRSTEWMSRSLTCAERIFEVIDAIPEVREDPNPVPLEEMAGGVEFRDVTFGYDKHKPVLKHVTFSVRPGEMIGLVGHSGAGKSTTINLICRLYDTDEGTITIDGIDIRKIRLADLRRQIGVVLQDPFLFNGTIAENIAYGKPSASREEIIAAAMAANAHDFIMRLPDGYDTIVQERGQRLSAGERQKISIARAILRNPKILILDEATSSVDTITEKQLQEAIARLVKDRTTFAIAHRLSTLRNADRLFVIENGQFVEFGTHEELLKKRGVYWKLVQLQKEVSKIKAVDG